MQIVIEIPESEIPKRQDIIEIPIHFIDGKICEAGGYGFVELPKGHGRLIDEDTIAGDGSWDWSDRLDATPTIIKADRAEKEES